jgi:hypothetical protein
VRGQRTPFLLAVIAIYYVIGIWLSLRATAHLKDRKSVRFFTVMHDPEEFSEEGNQLRRIANRFWLVGGLVVAVALFLL